MTQPARRPGVRVTETTRIPSRNFRCPDEVWDRALAATKARGTSVAAVCNAALIAYCDDYDRELALKRITAIEAKLAKIEDLAKRNGAKPAPRKMPAGNRVPTIKD